MTDRLKPRDARDVEEAVRWAVSDGKALDVVGQGSKRAIGRPSQTDLTLDVSGLTGVTLYEPEELVLSAKAGTPIAEIEALVDKHGQQLAFEPADYGPLFGQAAGQGTIGGVVAANLSGPRRIKAGAARDHVLGASAVTGRAETIKTGGRVVKNVTGYDLCKVLSGSWGTLAVMTDITIKVLPKPETEATVVVEGLSDAQACAAMTAATGSSADVSGAAHLPDHVASWFAGLKAEAATVLRLEGVAPSVKHREGQLAALMKTFGPVSILDAAASRAVWRDIRDVKAFAVASARHRPVWRISTAPAQAHRLVDLITPAAQMFYDWAGGLVWLGMPYEDEPDAGSVRMAVGELGGHATLIRAPAAVRAAVDVFQPEPPGLRALSHRVKESFDPKGVLNPGRMWAGI
ncbi:MAG TPA: glycolate oxidase subunit GlcE [Pseudolabrys sp.]|uniref:glycolate oxidase subunit GlcE n=1 Tax=Pseudolabrys sp. TaxID=1960880 RepID=UPI002DDCF93A|nr:glycolate oxidase subunit GlcE [Pseudolabrys sp.]HEV2628353.1 glycolate oxidase subunit GlcE [Pseudolabrys sp.]